MEEIYSLEQINGEYLNFLSKPGQGGQGQDGNYSK